VNPSFNLLLGQHRTPAFGQIGPGSAGGRKVQMKAGTLGHAAMDQCGFVRSVAVQNQMNLKIFRDVRIDGVEEPTNSVARCLRCSWLIILPVWVSKAANTDLVDVTMSASSGLTGAYGQQRLAAIECLKLSFFHRQTAPAYGREG
jgi:hypothetical protein